MKTKVCSCCGQELPIENFRIGRNNKPVDICNNCIKEKREQKKQAERDAILSQSLARFTNRDLLLELRRRNFRGTLKLMVEKTITEEKTINLTEFN